jgi:hypothetical protein
LAGRGRGIGSLLKDFGWLFVLVGFLVSTWFSLQSRENSKDAYHLNQTVEAHNMAADAVSAAQTRSESFADAVADLDSDASPAVRLGIAYSLIRLAALDPVLYYAPAVEVISALIRDVPATGTTPEGADADFLQEIRLMVEMIATRNTAHDNLLIGPCVSLERAKLPGLNLTRLPKVKQDGISNICFDGSDLTGAQFQNLRLSDVSFIGEDTSLRDVNFSNAILTCVHFNDVDLSGANFVEATLVNVDFRGANLEEATIVAGQFAQTVIDGDTTPPPSVTPNAIGGANAGILERNCREATPEAGS